MTIALTFEDFYQTVILHMHIGMHRWIAERFWLRCFHKDDSKSKIKSSGNRREESFFETKEFILEYPTYNNLEYDMMHTHAKKVKRDLREAELEAAALPSKTLANAPSKEEIREESRWIAPTGYAESGSTLCLVYVLQDSRYVELDHQTWDLDNEEERIDADNLFTGDEFLSANQVQIMAKDPGGSARQQARSAQPLAVPSKYQHRTLWRLPHTGILTAQRARLLKVGGKPSSQTLSQLLDSLQQARKMGAGVRGYAVNRLRELLDTQPHYKTLVAEQAIKIIEQIFGDNEENMIEAASVLYSVSVEPQRLLMLLADRTAPSLARPGAHNIKFKHEASTNMLL